jgi:hypothetical protein
MRVDQACLKLSVTKSCLLDWDYLQVRDVGNKFTAKTIVVHYDQAGQARIIGPDMPGEQFNCSDIVTDAYLIAYCDDLSGLLVDEFMLLVHCL